MSAVKFIITLVFQLRLFTEFAITQLNFRKKVDPSNFQRRLQRKFIIIVFLIPKSFWQNLKTQPKISVLIKTGH